MFINALKIFFGIALLRIPFACGVSFVYLFSGLVGLAMILSGIAGIFMWLGSLSKTDSNSPRPQNPA